ncbi:MAG: hypothetical protein EXR05_03755 [Acetobacteraceae bacterium]|nr:hypothetical protein [Acetobacteraceae bacterium]
MQRRNIQGIVIVLVCLHALLAYREMFIEPRVWGAICADITPADMLAMACALRAGLLWAQHYSLWGALALGLGLWAFIGAPFAVGVAGVAMGVAAVVNFNASWGMWGLALAAWAWIRFLPGPATAGATRGPPG